MTVDLTQAMGARAPGQPAGQPYSEGFAAQGAMGAQPVAVVRTEHTPQQVIDTFWQIERAAGFVVKNMAAGGDPAKISGERISALITLLEEAVLTARAMGASLRLTGSVVPPPAAP